jgi:two-component system response regulator NreC
LLLEAEPDIHITGETGNVLEVMGLIKRLRPDVLVLDLMMPGLNGVEIARQVHQQFTTTRIVIFSMYTNVAIIAESLAAGAKAFIPKKSIVEDLVYAIREVVAGREYFSPTLSDEYGDIQQRLEAYRKRADESLDLYDTLTCREREVLHLVGEGYTSAEITQRLSISPRTVDMHRRHMVRKLGLCSQSALVRYTLQRGLIPNPE